MISRSNTAKPSGPRGAWAAVTAPSMYEQTADDGFEVRVEVKAGTRLIGAAFIKETAEPEGVPAARAVLALGADDLTPLYKSGELGKTKGLGPATLSVLRELIETGESSYLERLQEATPGGLFDLLRVPGLGGTKVNMIHQELGVETLDDLEAVAVDGRLARLPKFGPKTVERILKGIEFARHATRRALFHRALYQADILQATVERHPDVIAARKAVLGAVDAQCFARACLALASLDLSPTAAKIRNPTLVLCGALDQTTPPALARELAQKIPGARYEEIADSGHCPMLEQPAALTKAILGG